jgi:hypothetical protein
VRRRAIGKAGEDRSSIAPYIATPGVGIDLRDFP